MGFRDYLSNEDKILIIDDISKVDCELIINIVHIISEKIKESSNTSILINFIGSSENKISFDDLSLINEYTKSISHILKKRKLAFLIDSKVEEHNIYSWLGMSNNYTKCLDVKFFYNWKSASRWLSVDLSEHLSFRS